MVREEFTYRFGPIASAGLQAPTIDGWTARVAPGDVFRHPREVLKHPTLSYEEKRGILASWASDAHAVESFPSLRCLPGSRAEVVPVDTVLAALTDLDAREDAGLGKRQSGKPPAQRRSRPFSKVRHAFRPCRSDDDDDPPPCSAAIMPRPRPPSPNAEAIAVFA